MDFLPNAKNLTEKLCGPQGPFGNAEVLNTAEGSRLFRSLVEVNPQATSRTLFRLFAVSPIQYLHTIDDGRRNLVWALEKLVFRKETFNQSSKVLLAFAAAENEEITNNATGQFLQLFQLFLSGTEANLDSRWGILEYTFTRPEIEFKTLALSACKVSLKARNFSRSGGAENQGSSIILEDNRPTGSEIKAYWSKVLEKLTFIAIQDKELSETALTYLVSSIQDVCYGGGSEMILQVISKIIALPNLDRISLSKAIEGILNKYSLVYSADVVREFKAILEELAPQTVEDKYRLIVAEPSWNHLQDASETEKQHKEKVNFFIYELLKNGNWHEYLPLFIEGSPYYGFYLGEKIGEQIGAETFFIESLKNNVSSSKALNTRFISGYLSKINQKDASKIIDFFLDHSQLADYALPLMSSISPDYANFKRVLQTVHKGILQTRALYALKYGRALDNLPTSEVILFLKEVFRIDLEGKQISIELVDQYTHSNAEKWKSCKYFIKEALLSDLFSPAQSIQSSLIYSWAGLANKYLIETAHQGMAKHLITQVIMLAANPFFSFVGSYDVVSLTEYLLNQYANIVLPVLLKNLLSDSYMSLRSLLGSENGTYEKEGILFSNESVYPSLLKWCQQTGQEAALKLAYMMPLNKVSQNSWHPFAKQLINQYGAIPGFMNEISANMGSFGMTGSSVAYYKKMTILATELLEHPIPEVQLWATNQVLYLEQCTQNERIFDEEHLM